MEDTRFKLSIIVSFILLLMLSSCSKYKEEENHYYPDGTLKAHFFRDFQDSIHIERYSRKNILFRRMVLDKTERYGRQESYDSLNGTLLSVENVLDRKREGLTIEYDGNDIHKYWYRNGVLEKQELYRKGVITFYAYEDKRICYYQNGKMNWYSNKDRMIVFDTFGNISFSHPLTYLDRTDTATLNQDYPDWQIKAVDYYDKLANGKVKFLSPLKVVR